MLARAFSNLNFDLDTYLDEQSHRFETGFEPLFRYLRFGPVAGRQLKQTKKAFRRALLAKFHSFGRNCEFGFVQRQFGAEPLDMFRFAAVSPRALGDGLRTQFAGLQIPENIKLEFEGSFEKGQPQFSIHVPLYGFRFHAGDLPPRIAFEDLRTLQIKRLSLLARKLFDDLDDAERIFVCHGDATLGADVDYLFNVMQSFGANRLLWVTLEEPGKPAGLVESIKDGLMRGYIDRFATAENIGDFSQANWIKICCEARRIAELPLELP